MAKKIVRYDKDKGAHEFGKRVLLFPVDHPDSDYVSNTKFAQTSEVVSWDKTTGVIETQNTIYVPNE